MWETGFKNLTKQTPSVLGPVRWHQLTDFCAPAHPPVGQKMSLVKHKIMTSANYTALVQDVGLTTKKCLQGKRL